MSNVQPIKDLYSKFGEGDIASVLAAMDRRIEWREAEGNPYQPTGEAWTNQDDIVNNLFVKIGSEWDGFTITPREFHDAGDTVVVEARYTGTYKATGKRLDCQVCHVWK